MRARLRALATASSRVAAWLFLLAVVAGAEERVVVPGAAVSLEPPPMLALSPARSPPAGLVGCTPR